MAIAIPRRQRSGWAPRSLLITGLLAIGAIGGAIYARPIMVSFLNAGGYITSQDAPSVRVALASASYSLGEPVTGAVTVSAASAVTVRELTVNVFPMGSRRPGVDEASIRTRTLVIPINEALAPGATATYAFTWDQRTDTVLPAPAGAYVMSVRLSATLDHGDAHAALTLAANEPTVELR